MENEIDHSQGKLPRVAILLTPARRAQVLSRAAEEQLASFAAVVTPQGETLTDQELSALLDGAVACLTGWGTPALSDALLANCPQLGMVAHTAGSVRHLISQAAIEKGLKLCHAAAIIASSVAEFVVSQALLCLRQLHEIDRDMRVGRGWNEIRDLYPGRLLGSQTVGVVGVGRVGRAVIHLLRAFGCRLLAYDPYLTAEQAAQLGVELVGLDELLTRADVVTLHAPVLPETVGMIGEAQLARLRGHAIFINAARAALVDEEALLRELKSGRIIAALDVYQKEPLPLDSPLRSLPNVVLSPHTAGHTIDTHLLQGQAMVDEVQRFLRGEPLRYEITPAAYAILA